MTHRLKQPDLFLGTDIQSSDPCGPWLDTPLGPLFFGLSETVSPQVMYLQPQLAGLPIVGAQHSAEELNHNLIEDPALTVFATRNGGRILSWNMRHLSAELLIAPIPTGIDWESPRCGGRRVLWRIQAHRDIESLAFDIRFTQTPAGSRTWFQSSLNDTGLLFTDTEMHQRLLVGRQEQSFTMWDSMFQRFFPTPGALRDETAADPADFERLTDGVRLHIQDLMANEIYQLSTSVAWAPEPLHEIEDPFLTAFMHCRDNDLMNSMGLIEYVPGV